MPSRRAFLASLVSTLALWPFRGLNLGALTMTVAETLASALGHLRKARRIVGPGPSYAKDNPAEYAAVIAYLNGGPRPNPATEMGKGLVEVEDARRASVSPTPSNVGISAPTAKVNP